MDLTVMAVFIFVFGLIIGSFLNVLICRLPKSQPITGRSRCPNCRKQILWYHNIPVVSFLFLGGRCHNCRSKISWQYPIIELITGGLFAASFFVFGNQPPFLAFSFFLIGLFIAITVIDLFNYLILDWMLLAGLGVSAVILPFFFWGKSGAACAVISCSLGDSFLGAAVLAGLLLTIFVVTRGKGMGLGDVKLAALIGFIFGFVNGALIMYLAVALGAVIGVLLLLFKRATLKTKLPLGTFIGISAIIFIIAGQSILWAIHRSSFDLIFK